jgi:hypothetical protein
MPNQFHKIRTKCKVNTLHLVFVALLFGLIPIKFSAQENKKDTLNQQVKNERIALLNQFAEKSIIKKDTVLVVSPKKTLKHLNSLNFSVGAGSMILFYLPFTGYYEHLFLNKSERKVNYYLMDAGAGHAIVWGDTFDYAFSRFGVLLGTERNYTEIKFGIMASTIGSGLLPSISVANRIQKSNSNFTFKYGVGWPEGIYFTLGTCF